MASMGAASAAVVPVPPSVRSLGESVGGGLCPATSCGRSAQDARIGHVSRVASMGRLAAGRHRYQLAAVKPQLMHLSGKWGRRKLSSLGLDGKDHNRQQAEFGVFVVRTRAEAPDSGTSKTTTDSSWAVPNDFNEDYILISKDADDVMAELMRLKRENEALKEKLRTALPKVRERLKPRTLDGNLNTSFSTRSAITFATPPSTVTPSTMTPPIPSVPKPSELVLSPSEVPTLAPSIPAAPTSKPAVAASFDLETRIAEFKRSRTPSPPPTPTPLAPPPKVEEKKAAVNAISLVFVASEAAPWSKTGGLGDVAGALPIALARRGHRVMVIVPRYLNGVTDALYANALDTGVRLKLPCFEGLQEVGYFHEFREGVDWVFVDHPSYHRAGNPYGDGTGAFGDNTFRFTILCLAATEAPLNLKLRGSTYGEDVVFIANDWHASLVPLYLAAKYRQHNVYRQARCILAIHNLSHQGVEPATFFPNLGLPDNWYGALEWVFPEWARKHALDKGEAVNLLKGAIVTSDRVVTVSKGYAWEIQTVEGGWGLDGLLRSRQGVLDGITNGVDVDDWDPSSDRFIEATYTFDNLEGKAKCKAALQREVGLPVSPNVPLIGFIGRLDYQKGPDLIQQAMPELMRADVQFIMLGSGDKEIEEYMRWAETIYPDRFRGWVGFSVPVAHRITAGCDILLMPSRFEPCGLNQLYAMRYGTVPVAHATGGLRDTIEDYNPYAGNMEGVGTGWTFSPATSEAMLEQLWVAYGTYLHYKEAWKNIQKRGMTADYTWDKAAVQYEQIFQWAKIDPPYA